MHKNTGLAITRAARRRGGVVAAASLALVASTSGVSSASTGPHAPSSGYLRFTPRAVNDQGVLIGNLDDFAYYEHGDDSGVVRNPRSGELSYLKVPGGAPDLTKSIPVDINDAGAVVGRIEWEGPAANPSVQAPVLWPSATADPVVLPSPLSGHTWVAGDITPSGRILLNVDYAGEPNGGVDGPVYPSYVYDHGVLTSVADLTGGKLTAATALNDKGQLIGRTSPRHASNLFWDGTAVVALRPLPGKVTAYAIALSENGVIGGSSGSSGGLFGYERPVLWTASGAPTALPAPADALSAGVTDLSESGDPVGSYLAPEDGAGGGDTVVAWRHGRMSIALGWTISAPVINDKEFVATGHGPHSLEGGGAYLDRHAW